MHPRNAEAIQTTMQRLHGLESAPPETVADSWNEVITHEYGHVLDAELATNADYIGYGFAAPSIVNSYGVKWSETLRAKLDKIALTEGKKISDYAAKNDQEYWAEAFVVYMRGENEHYKINSEVLSLFKKLDKGKTK